MSMYSLPSKTHGELYFLDKKIYLSKLLNIFSQMVKEIDDHEHPGLAVNFPISTSQFSYFFTEIYISKVALIVFMYFICFRARNDDLVERMNGKMKKTEDTVETVASKIKLLEGEQEKMTSTIGGQKEIYLSRNISKIGVELVGQLKDIYI